MSLRKKISVINFIKNYFKTFSSMDINNIIKYYDLPLVIIDSSSKKEPFIVLKKKKELKNYFFNLFKILKKIYKYKLTKIEKIIYLKRKYKYTIINLSAARYKENKIVFQRIKITYLIKKKINGFKIVCFVVK